ncbi:MAG: tetratricopeptide repeat protein [Pseudomonadota bacterium]
MATQTAQNPVREKLLKGLAYQQSGEIEKAQRCYKQVLKKAPSNPDALHLLGVTYRQQGFPKRAVEYIQKAIASNPNQSPFYANLARAMMDVGTDPESLLAVCNKALQLNPIEREALNIKGIALTNLDEWEQAEEVFQNLLTNYPNFPDVYQNYGLLLRNAKEYEKSILFFNKAVSLLPDTAFNYVERARSRLEMKDYKISGAELAVALDKFPENADVQHEIARLMFKYGDLVRALPYAEFAVKDAPGDSNRLVTLGVTLHSLGRFQEAAETLEEAVKCSKNPAGATEWNLSLVYLAQGRLSEGWKFHSARFEDNNTTTLRRKFTKPRWGGEDLAGKTIMVWNDQGLGDAFRHSTMLDELSAMAGQVIFEPPVKCISLMRRSFPKIEVRHQTTNVETLEATNEDFDFQISFADLAIHFRQEISDFSKAQHPTIKIDLDLANEYAGRIKDHSSKPVIGVAWRSGQLEAWRARWYLDIKQFSPILQTPDATFVNLQYAAIAKEIDWVRHSLGIELLNWSDINLMDDLEAAAALSACCDLIISSNTSVADIAGAVDVPCWRFGPPHGVTLLGQQNSPWTRSVKYYRMPVEKSAEAIVPTLQSDLSRWLETCDPQAKLDRLRPNGS